MSPTEKNRIITLVFTQAALVIIFTLIDLAGLFIGHKINIVAIPKALLSLSATLTVWTAGTHAFSSRDSVFLRIIFTCTFITDLFVLSWTHFFPDSFFFLPLEGPWRSPCSHCLSGGTQKDSSSSP